jgi:hypothetical protein
MVGVLLAELHLDLNSTTIQPSISHYRQTRVAIDLSTPLNSSETTKYLTKHSGYLL